MRVLISARMFVLTRIEPGVSKSTSTPPLFLFMGPDGTCSPLTFSGVRTTRGIITDFFLCRPDCDDRLSRVCGSVEQEALEEVSSTEASFSPLAAVVSVESPLSCSAPSAVPNVDVDEAAGVAFGSEASEPDGFFVHCRAFFFSVKRLILPGSLKKMLFFTLSPLTWEWSMVTRQARGAVPLLISLSPFVWMT